jgi:hypothetical protein
MTTSSSTDPGQLIAQSRVLAAVYAGKWKPASMADCSALKFHRVRPDREDQLTPIRPALDLAAAISAGPMHYRPARPRRQPM